MARQQYAIVAQNIKKDYYQYRVFSRGKLLTRALQGVSFVIREGEFVGLIGVNGAGKSTLMRILTTNLEKTAGKVIIANHDIDKEEEEVKKQISWMFGQDYFGIGWSSLEKNMHLAAAFLGLDKEEAQTRIDTLIKRFRLEEKRHMDVWRLSSGMLAKYSLAVALLKRPSILFLDEPLLGLDTYAKDEIRDILRELNAKGTTILYTDHQLQEVEKICKRLLIINEGKLLFDGTTKKLKEFYRDTHVLDLVCRGQRINRALYDLRKQKLCTDYEIVESDGELHTIKLYTPMDSQKMVVRVAEALQKKKLVVAEMNAGLLGLEDVYRKFLRVDPLTHTAKTLASFGKYGEQPLKEFESLLRHTNPKLRAQACAAFWKRNKNKVRPILLQMLQGSHPMQEEALQVIGQIRDPSFMEHALCILEKKETSLHDHALLALAKMGNETIVPALLKLLLDHDNVRFVLEHLPAFDVNIIKYLQEKIHHLSVSDKAFLQHHCFKMKHAKHLLELLGLQHRDYGQWRREHFEKKRGVN